MNTPAWGREVDLVVAGGGGGGLVAAVVAHDLGLRPLLLESAPKLGGSTALAAGGIWIPLNDRMREANLDDDREAAISYLLALSQGEEMPETCEVVTAYVDNAAAMVRHLERHTSLRFEPAPGFPDYRMDLPGARYGRVMTPAVYDAKKLGEWREQVRASVHYPPVGLHEVDQQGGPGRAVDIGRQLIPQRMRDDMWAGGAAGIAALVRACLDREIPLLLDHRAVRLITEEDRVVGVDVERPDGDVHPIRGRRGVVLATGGADWDERSNRRNLSRPFHRSLTPPANRGDGQRMGSALGLPLALMHESYWCPAYLLPGHQYDGAPLYRPCVADRCMPHSIVVNHRGERFVDESLPYNDFVRDGVQAWDGQRYEHPNVPMFLIADQQFRERYTLCGVAPGMPTPEWMTIASTLRELATQLGIEADGLEITVQRFNAAARDGVDLDFRRGEHGYGRYYSDPGHEPPLPHPSLGSLEQPPFYGLPLHVATFGHKGGLVTNRHAQVLDQEDTPVAGLYAVGNVAASLHQNSGYAGGAMIGRAMTFGFLAAHHAAALSVPAD